ncbi:MAG: IS110 family transposase [Thermoplasmatales archaeon]|nr:IS110 family transposase [Thermoplasmatales archaeon]
MKLYIGMDVDKDKCIITSLDKNGEQIDQYRIENNSTEIERFIQKTPRNAEIALESSTCSKPIYQQLKKHGMKVHMAAPGKISLISKSKKKTDPNDSRLLADLLRLGYLPESYVPNDEIENLRKLVRYRRSLGEKKTVVKNQVHAILMRNGIKHGFSDFFGRDGTRFLKNQSLPLTEQTILEGGLREIGFLYEESNVMDLRLAEIAMEYKDVRLLMSIPGVGYYSALVIISEIGDISRFPCAKKLVGYAGLAPRVYQSGNIKRYGRISKDGPSILRWVLTIAAEGAIKKSGKLKRFHARLNKHIGYSKAVVATARKLLIIIFHMLTNGVKYEERDDDLTHRKIRMMETKSKRMKRLKDKKTPIIEKHKKLMNKGMKMLINSDSDANLG